VKRSLKFAVTHVVDAPNDAVWEVLGDFGTEHRWTRTVNNCTRDTAEVRVGTVRVCQLPRPLMGRTTARETLTEFETGRALTYLLDGPAGPFAVASSRWSTSPVARRGTAITVEGSFSPKNRAVRVLAWPVAKPMLRRLTRGVLRELEAFLVRRDPLGRSPAQ
jgi:uncharacterized protein YndB with AHSA1/START domain